MPQPSHPIQNVPPGIHAMPAGAAGAAAWGDRQPAIDIAATTRRIEVMARMQCARRRITAREGPTSTHRSRRIDPVRREDLSNSRLRVEMMPRDLQDLTRRCKALRTADLALLLLSRVDWRSRGGSVLATRTSINRSGRPVPRA